MRILVTLAPLLSLVAAACGESHHSRVLLPAPDAAELQSLEKIEVPPPPFTEDAFPCSECHDPELPVNNKRRELSMAHEEIELQHDEENRWCLDCHSASDRDKLHLASGELIDFSESYKLCGQCHGDKFRDWRVGVHGRRSGEWNGQKTYLLCVHCHNAHAPAFPKLDPMPAPVPPQGDLR